MNTDAWIDLLARGAGPAPRALAARRLMPAAAAGLLVSTGLALGLLGPLPASAFSSSFPWVKLGYTGLLALAAGWLAARSGKPAGRLAGPARAVFAVVLAMLVLGALALVWGTVAEQRLAALLGSTWLQCPWFVLGLSVPALGLALWAMRGLAPARPRLAGGAAGLLAGATGAFGYSLACPEASPAFVAVWYSAGILLTGLVGALVGGRLLRW